MSGCETGSGLTKTPSYAGSLDDELCLELELECLLFDDDDELLWRELDDDDDEEEDLCLSRLEELLLRSLSRRSLSFDEDEELLPLPLPLPPPPPPLLLLLL